MPRWYGSSAPKDEATEKLRAITCHMCDERIALVNFLRVKFEDLTDGGVLAIIVSVFKQMAKTFKKSQVNYTEQIHEKIHGRFIAHALDVYAVTMTKNLGSVYNLPRSRLSYQMWVLYVATTSCHHHRSFIVLGKIFSQKLPQTAHNAAAFQAGLTDMRLSKKQRRALKKQQGGGAAPTPAIKPNEKTQPQGGKQQDAFKKLDGVLNSGSANCIRVMTDLNKKNKQFVQKWFQARKVCLETLLLRFCLIIVIRLGPFLPAAGGYTLNCFIGGKGAQAVGHARKECETQGNKYDLTVHR